MSYFYLILRLAFLKFSSVPSIIIFGGGGCWLELWLELLLKRLLPCTSERSKYPLIRFDEVIPSKRANIFSKFSMEASLLESSIDPVSSLVFRDSVLYASITTSRALAKPCCIGS